LNYFRIPVFFRPQLEMMKSKNCYRFFIEKIKKSKISILFETAFSLLLSGHLRKSKRSAAERRQLMSGKILFSSLFSFKL